MNKTEILNDLVGRVKRVGNPQLVDSTMRTNTYDVPVFETSAGRNIKRTVPIYVVDEGTTFEEAFYRHPDQPSSEDFRDLARTAVEKHVNQTDTYIRGEADTINESERFAIIKVYYLPSGSSSVTTKLVMAAVEVDNTISVYPMA